MSIVMRWLGIPQCLCISLIKVSCFQLNQTFELLIVSIVVKDHKLRTISKVWYQIVLKHF
jgi:hypothetical protein